jgi:putative FmdB family regulatory protein
MPIYEFRCKQCHKVFEELVTSRQQDALRQVPIADRDSRLAGTESLRPVACPECQSRNVTRLFSVFGVGTSDNASVPTMDMSMCGTCGRQTPQPCHELN